MKFLIILAIALVYGRALASANDLERFEKFKAENKKTYSNSIEEEFRLKIFQDNLRSIERRHPLLNDRLGAGDKADLLESEIDPTQNNTLANQEFDKFKVTYSKIYATSIEEKFRKAIFQNNFNEIVKHNKLYDNKTVSFSMGVNKYSDLLNSEFVKLKCGLNQNLSFGGKRRGTLYVPTPDLHAAESIDWRKKGAVTYVKDQGSCRACWSFSATGAIEGQNFLATGQLFSLSEQNLIDCSTAFGNSGCDGGFMTRAFEYVTVNRGISEERKYPYEAKNGDCRYHPEYSVASISGFTEIPSRDEHLLESAVTEVGPISVAIDSSGIRMQHYKKGIYYQKECSSNELDHGMLVVGYGKTEDNEEYWLVKNSWGPDWGESGYIRMAKNKNNHCGIATMASFPWI